MKSNAAVPAGQEAIFEIFMKKFSRGSNTAGTGFPGGGAPEVPCGIFKKILYSASTAKDESRLKGNGTAGEDFPGPFARSLAY